MKIYDASLAGTVTTVSGSTSNLTGSFTGSFSGSYVGDGSGLLNIPASGVTGLELNKIVDGGTNATISTTQGLRVNTDTIITGSLTVTGNLTAQQFIVSSSVTHLTTSFSSGSQKFGDSMDDTHQFTGSMLLTGSLTVVTTGTELQVNAGGVNIGNALTDNHVISGSVLMTGSLTVGGAGTFSRNINSTGEGTFMGLDAQSVPRLGFVKIAGAQPFLGFGGDTFTIRASNGSTIATSGSFTTALAITTAGNVGIGTSTPSAMLTVQANSSNSSDATYLALTNASGENVGHIDFNNTFGNLSRITGTKEGGGGLANDGIISFSTAVNSTLAERVRITSAGVVQPGANGTQDLGTTSLRWATIYTSDLSLSNGIGDYTIVEGEEKLYLYNNKNNKVYSFVLQEEDPLTATPKKS